MKQYYIRRIRKFCDGRCNVARLFLNTIKRKIGYLAVENIKSLDNNIFDVPSEKTGEMYEVNISLGCCNCEKGLLGSFCKHQGAVYFFMDKSYQISHQLRLRVDILWQFWLLEKMLYQYHFMSL